MILRVLPVLALACADSGFDLDQWLPGGQTTNTRLLGIHAFEAPAANLSAEAEMAFFSGNGFFEQAWVQAPASTTARDGLGPLFNARSCSACHLRDGRGAPPDDGQAPLAGLLLRLSVPGPGGPAPDPVYGDQLQDLAVPGVAAEAVPRIERAAIEVAYPDGVRRQLQAPRYVLDEPAYGPLPDDLMVSPRVAPHMVGLGLLEAIPEERLAALADPADDDGDGISGRLQWRDAPDGPRVGRFGWKADQPDVEAQVAGAFAGDMGLTSRLHPVDDCTEAQAAPGDPMEVADHILDVVTTYSRALAVPVRRAADDPAVRRGQRRFEDLGCGGCHVPRHVTGPAALPALEGQVIWPYTDLLLHDMGPDLADDRPVGEASGREWRTPPLWGIGLVEVVGGHRRFLHDGRAEGIEEAILWHGGEAGASRDAFVALPARERAAVVAFVEDL